MGKRFIDTKLMQKEWYMDLTTTEKAAWLYLLCECDAVGVWKPNFRLADFCIGEAVDWEGLLKSTNGNIQVLENGKWFLVDFCDFQYGELKATCKPHASYISLLKKHGLFGTLYKGFEYPLNRVQEKEKELELEKEEEDSNPFDIVKAAIKKV